MDDMSKKEVLRFIDGIENGGLDLEDAYQLLMTFDSLLAYFILKYLREKNPITESSSGPGERLMKLLAGHTDAQKLAKEPANEPMIEWFEDTYSLKEFFQSPEQYVDLIVDKLEG